MNCHPSGSPDSSAIGAAKPQEDICVVQPPSCAYGTPIGKLSGPPVVKPQEDICVVQPPSCAYGTPIGKLSGSPVVKQQEDICVVQ